MPRTLQIEYPGAMHHVITCFMTVNIRERFIAPVALMLKGSHLLPDTPKAEVAEHHYDEPHLEAAL